MKSLSLQEANGRRGRGANRPSGSVGGGVPLSLARRATEKMCAAHELGVDDVNGRSLGRPSMSLPNALTITILSIKLAFPSCAFFPVPSM